MSGGPSGPPHCETTGFIPASGASYTSSIGRHGTLGLPAGRELREPATAGRTCPRGSWRVPCSPGGAAEQLRPRTGAGRCISARPRRVYRDVERGLQETVWQAGPRQMDCQLISMYL